MILINYIHTIYTYWGNWVPNVSDLSHRGKEFLDDKDIR